MVTNESIEERFGLVKANFIVDPDIEAGFYAYRSDINIGAVVESLQEDLLTGLAPKRLVWGPFGGGKTHTLHKIVGELEKITDIHSVYVDCPDLTRRATFLDLYRDGIMRSIGQDFVLQLFEATLKGVGWALREELLKGLRDALGDEELSKAVVRLVDPGFNRLRLWAFISGVSLNRADLGDLGQTQDLTVAESSRLAQMLILLGKLTRERLGRTLVLVLDEMDRLRQVGPETTITFETGFRRLVDPNQKTVAVLIGASAGAKADMPEIFQERGAVMSRLTRDAEVEIRSLPAPDVDRFIKDIVAHFRNPNVDITRLLTKASTTETVSQDFFPFTEEAITALKGRLTGAMTPREITLNMTRLLGRAHRLNQTIVTSDIVR